MAGELRPWARFVLLSGEPVGENNDIEFFQSDTRVGRLSRRADIVVDLPYISGVHCRLKLEGFDASGEPAVRIYDLSRNHIYVNEEILGRNVDMLIRPGDTIHFTRPGLIVNGHEPRAYRYELLQDAFTPANNLLRDQSDRARGRSRPARAVQTATRSTRSVASDPTTESVATSSRGSGNATSDLPIAPDSTPLRGASNVASDTPTLPAVTPSRGPGNVVSDLLTTLTPTLSSGPEVVTTQPLTGKRQRHTGDVHMLEEMEVEATRNLIELGSGAKRRRTNEPVVIDDKELTTNQQLHNSNQELRAKLELAAQRESELRIKISHLERSSDGLKDELQVLEESKKLAENEAALKGERLADREAEIDQLKNAMTALESKVEGLEKEAVLAKAREVSQAKLLAELKEEREKIEIEMASMTSRLDTTQTKLRRSEEEKRRLLAQKSELEMAVDSVQTRSDQAEEGKRGVNEENTLLRTRLERTLELFAQFESMAKKGRRIAANENAMIANELEELKNSENPIYSSEHSQPPPTQEIFVGDTQPEDSQDQETLDVDAVVARAELPTGIRRPDPFSSSKPLIDLQTTGSISVDFLDQHQQPISSISTDLSLDGTPSSFEKSSLEESGLSSQSSSSKTPPAPPLQRFKPSAPPPTLHESVEESKEEKSDDENTTGEGDENTTADGTAESKDDNGKVAADEDDGNDADDDGDDAEETVLPEDDAKEEDKENTPIQPTSAGSPIQEKTATGQERWLQTIVVDEDTKNDEASEGVFDDETQLSGGEQ